MAKIDVYGWGGVNTTKNPIQLENGELLKSQNAFRDAAGEHGALRKRPGLTKVNAVALTGSVFGFVNVPLDEITTRQFLIGVDQSTSPSYQWFTSTDAFSTSATATMPAASADPDWTPHIILSSDILTNRATQSETLFIYPGAYTRGTPQPIRIFDGVTDRQLVAIPLNPEVLAAGHLDYAIRSGSINQMLLVGTKLYIVSIDYFHYGFGKYSRILEYDFDTGALRQIGAGAGSALGYIGDGGVIFFSLAYHQGWLYAGIGSAEATTNSTESGVYRIRPGIDSAWIYDYDNSAAQFEVPFCMASYKGKLYVGMRDLNSGTSRVMVRDFAGAYAASLSMGSANGSGFTDMLVFGDNLYACAHDNNGVASITTIRKFDGTTWTTAKTIDSATSQPRVGVAMVVHAGRLYVLGVSGTRNGIVTHTPDGTTWTDYSATLSSGNVTSVFGVLAY